MELDSKLFDWSTLTAKTVKYNGKTISFKYSSLQTYEDIDKIQCFDVSEELAEIIMKKRMDWTANARKIKNDQLRAKRKETIARNKELSTYTPFEWRKKLWQESAIYTERTPYSPGYFEIYINADVKLNEKRKWLTSQTGKRIGSIGINNRYDDVTIQSVKDKVSQYKQKLFDEHVKHIEDVLNKI